MAWDCLAIQGSAVPSKHTFSSGGITATACQNRLSVDTFESLQLLKSAYRNRHIIAADQAGAHLKTLWDKVDLRDIVNKDGEVL
jgi:hypothetical protein